MASTHPHHRPRPAPRPPGRRPDPGGLPGHRRVERVGLPAALRRLHRLAAGQDAARPPRPPSTSSAMRPARTPTTSFTRAHTLCGRSRTGRTTSIPMATTTGIPATSAGTPASARTPASAARRSIYSKDIAQKRAGRATNLVVISTCHNAEANTTLPAAFGIAKTKGTFDLARPDLLLRLPGHRLRQRPVGLRAAVLGRPGHPPHGRRSVRHRRPRFVRPRRLRRRLVGQLRVVRLRRPDRVRLPAMSVEVSSCVQPSRSPASFAHTARPAARGSDVWPGRSSAASSSPVPR